MTMAESKTDSMKVLPNVALPMLWARASTMSSLCQYLINQLTANQLIDDVSRTAHSLETTHESNSPFALSEQNAFVIPETDDVQLGIFCRLMGDRHLNQFE